MSHTCLPRYGDKGRICWCGRYVPTPHELALDTAIANGWTLHQAAEYAAQLRNNVVDLDARRRDLLRNNRVAIGEWTADRDGAA